MTGLSTNLVWRGLHALLPHNGGLAATEHKLLNLARRGFRQLGDEADRVRRFEVRHPAPCKFSHLFRIRARPRLEDDESVWRFAPSLIRHSNDTHFEDCGVP